MAKDDWKTKLSKKQYEVLREKGTESPFSGHLLQNKKEGTYTCAACSAELFGSDTKFESNSGWPSFYDVKNSDAVELETDSSFGMERTEVTCKACGGHLGHVFNDGPSDQTGQRYCINSVSLNFMPDDGSDMIRGDGESDDTTTEA